ncbi:hypothetical protein [Ascidiaceihabitans sp.]|uniref:hypothetical protein n=1 Tax=Ascidiaceihabitans sp. TaxID=1872644 RepID=UPI00329A7B94
MPDDISGSQSVPERLPEDVQSAASALIAATGLIRMSYNFIESLNRIVFFDDQHPPELDLKAVIAAQNKLRTEFAREVLTFVWKESGFVPSEAAELAGIEKKFTNGQITKNGLAKKICNVSEITDLDKFNAIRTDIGRISNAAEAFGLLEHDDIAENARPLTATLKLHELMMDCHCKNAEFMNSLVLGSDALDDPCGGDS